MCSLDISIFLYACESWTLTAELEKRTQAFEMRCYWRLLNISYKDHLTNEEVCRKIQAVIGECDELMTLVKKQKQIFWPHFKVFWFSKDNPTRNTERKKKKRQTEEEVGRQCQSVQEWTLPAPLGHLKTGQDGKGLLRIHLWCPNRLPRLWDRIE